jgi:hypothetical protein
MDEYEVDDAKSYECVLTAAVPSKDGVIITLASDIPPPDTLLELANGIGQSSLVQTKFLQKEEKLPGAMGVVLRNFLRFHHLALLAKSG